MAIVRYLAMTAAEIRENSVFPPKIAWMACHFSPYTTGLSNLPGSLPPGSLLILNDLTPIHLHDPAAISRQLSQCIRRFDCCGVLLDFQRPDVQDTAALASFLVRELPCRVCVSDRYAQTLSCPVFLPPPPHHVPLSQHLQPWLGREIWLEMALDAQVVTLTPEGADFASLFPWEAPPGGHWEEKLHCHYKIETSEAEAAFTLWRTQEDLDALLNEAETLGVTTAVGLYQELMNPHTSAENAT